MIWIIAPRCGRRYYKKMRSMTRHSPRQLAQLAQLALAIVVAGLVAMASTMPAQAQTQQAPAAGVQAAEYPFGFKAYGVFSRMITQRNYLAVVALKDACLLYTSPS